MASSSSSRCFTLLCTVRLLFALLLVVSILLYIYQLHDDQQISFGIGALDHIGGQSPSSSSQTGNETGGGGSSNHHPPPPPPPPAHHRGDVLYVAAFMALFLFSLLAMVALCFGSLILLAITLPLYILLVVLDFLYVGRGWLDVDFISGYGSLAAGVLTSLFGAVYLMLLFFSGPEDSGGGGGGGNQGEGNLAAKVVNFKNRAPPSDRVKAVMQQQQRRSKKSKK